MPKYVLHYFDGRGRAELLRLLFAYGGIPFTDNRLSFPDWPATKPTTPLQQVPYLEIDDVVVPQSISIARYLAKEVNLYGANNLEQLKVDAILDTLLENTNSFVRQVRYIRDPEEQKQAAIKYATEELPKHFQNVDKLISLYGRNGYAVGDSLTVADLAVFDASTYVTFNAVQPIWQKFPHISQVVKTVQENPKVAEYLKSRPEATW